MRLSAAKAPARDLKIEFPQDDGTVEVLALRYRPASYTLARAQEMQEASQRDSRRLAELLAELILSWDLTDEDGTPIEINAVTIYEVCTTPLLQQIGQAIAKDQTVGEAGGPSADG